jgi:MFS family permease
MSLAYLNNRNLWLLALSQVFGFTTAIVNVFLSGIIGSQLVSIKALATLPPTLFIIGTAICTVFASYIMSKFGRKFGFISASIASSLSSLLAAYSISIENFVLFCISCLLMGVGMAFVHQYRFAASESVDKENIPKAVSIILLAGILSAFIGPNIANLSKDLIFDQLYVGSYLALACLNILPAILLAFFKNIDKSKENRSFKGRSYKELISQPRFLQAIVASAFAYAIMAFLMTATPISMHINEKFSLNETGIVLQWHIVGMFLPSLITGRLIQKYGHNIIMYCGISFFLISFLIGYFDQVFLNYLISLIFLGMGWNFLFISGTSLLVITYRSEEKYKAQGFNDLAVFSTQALGALLAGFLLNITSWQTINLMCLPFLAIIVLTIWRANRIKISKNL